MFNTSQSYAPHIQSQNGWGTTLNADSDIAYKFHTHDQNKDGILEKSEFRSFLKEIFASHASTQFLEDAIEETLWRESNVDLNKAKSAIRGIKETFNIDSQPSVNAPFSLEKYPHNSTTTTTTKPFPYNAQGDMLVPAASLPPPPPSISKHNLGGRPPLASISSKPTFNPFTQPQLTTTNTQVSGSAPVLPQGLSKAPMAPIRVLPAHPSTDNIPLTQASQKDERRAFIEYINTNVALKSDSDVSPLLPISTDLIYDVISNGWLFCKLLNTIQPELVPSTKIKVNPRNAFEKIENHTLAIAAAKKLGCSVVNIGPEDLLQGKPLLVLGLLWQIIKRDVLAKVSLAQHPEIYKLAKGSTSLKEITESSPEEVLLKWANHHLGNTNSGLSLSNFSKDVKDGTAYTVIMHQVAPHMCNTDALKESDPTKRAQMIVENAKKLDCARFVTAADITNGNTKLNLAFMADLFNKHSGLELPTLEEMERLKKQNTSLSGILDEAEARLRQILADGQLAYELQQQEILLYRQRKLKEQEDLADQEAALRAQLQQEEMMLAQQKRMKELSLADQEQFALEEQRKENMRAESSRQQSSRAQDPSYSSRPKVDYSSSASSSRASSSRTPTPSAPRDPSFVLLSNSTFDPADLGDTSSLPRIPTHISSHPTSSTSSASIPATRSRASTYPTSVPITQSDTTQNYYPSSAQSSQQSNRNQYATQNQQSTQSQYSTQPIPYAAQPNAYAGQPNPYNVAYPPAYNPASYAYTASAQPAHVTPAPYIPYTEPHTLSHDVPHDTINVPKKGGVFERMGKKMDRAFH